jgi:SAM-dependent methyltransferase
MVFSLRFSVRRNPMVGVRTVSSPVLQQGEVSMPAADRDELKRTFDCDAELYDKARPNYPDEIFDDLVALAALKPGARLLEIGCGTGKATLALAKRGLCVVCIELGESLAAIARRNLARYLDVDVLTSDFESWDPQAQLFDMVFAATSWHWIDPRVRYQKTARLLKPAGVLAILDGGGHAFPEGFDPFFTEIQKTYEALGEPHLEWPPPRPAQSPDRRGEIERSGLFRVVEIKRYLWSVEYTAESYIDVLNTYSGHIAWPQWKRETLYAEVRRLISEREEKRIRKHYLSILHLSRLIS